MGPNTKNKAHEDMQDTKDAQTPPGAPQREESPPPPESAAIPHKQTNVEPPRDPQSGRRRDSQEVVRGRQGSRGRSMRCESPARRLRTKWLPSAPRSMLSPIWKLRRLAARGRPRAAHRRPHRHSTGQRSTTASAHRAYHHRLAATSTDASPRPSARSVCGLALQNAQRAEQAAQHDRYDAAGRTPEHADIRDSVRHRFGDSRAGNTVCSHDARGPVQLQADRDGAGGGAQGRAAQGFGHEGFGIALGQGLRPLATATTKGSCAPPTLEFVELAVPPPLGELRDIAEILFKTGDADWDIIVIELADETYREHDIINRALDRTGVMPRRSGRAPAAHAQAATGTAPTAS